MEKKNQLGPALMIGIPTLGRPVSLEWALAFKATSPPINFNNIFSIVKNEQVADARNLIAKQALEQNCKYLYFLGDDVEVPPHGLRQLIYRLENDESIGVVGGVYCCKCDPPFPLVFQEFGQGSYWDWKIGEFFRCVALGMDCTLIRVECLRSMEYPWFKTVDEDDFLDAVTKAEQWTEDLYFFNKLRDTPWKTYCDASVICNHWNVYEHRAFNLPADSLPKRQTLMKDAKKLLLIGPGLDIIGDWDTIHIPVDYRVDITSLPFETNQFDWVLLTSPNEKNPFRGSDEMQRVLKVGGKLSMCIHPQFNISYIAHQLKGTVNGTYVEIIKNGLNSSR